MVEPARPRPRGRGRRRFLRRIAIGALAALLLVAAAAGALWWWLRSSLPDYAGSLALDGVAGEVRIVRDADAIPHIFAAGDADAYFALGLVHAQDRLWQMDLFRRAGQGRLAEVLGPDAVAHDRWTRGLGLHRLAQDAAESLDPEVGAALQSYADGVNAWMRLRADSLPPEFALLGYRPEPWQPADSLVLAKLMSFQLSHNFRLELLRAALEQRLGASAAGDLLPPSAAAPATLAGFDAVALARLALSLPAGLGGRGASNEWALAGSRTASGAPLLANDPHNPMMAPNLWYLARIETPGLSLAGATVPGVPFLVLGHNADIAWAMTSTGSDVQDLFVEKVDPADPRKYLTPDGSQPFQTRQERILVDGADPVDMTVRITRHGPLITDIEPGAGEGLGDPLALAFADLTPQDSALAALYRMNRAKDWAAFRDALRLWRGPPQNFAFADRAGHIGFIAPAPVPLRTAGDGRRPAPGWTGEADWHGEIPFDERPQGIDPPSGLIVNANNAIVGPDYPYFIGDPLDDPFRAERILAVLGGGGKADVAAIERLQHDSVAEEARQLLPLLLETPAEGRAAEAVALLRAWDLRMDRDRPEPLIYSAWLRELTRQLLAARLGPDLFAAYWAQRPVVLTHVLRDAPDWCDDPATADAREDCGEVLQRSLTLALDGLASEHGSDPAGWRWGDAHIAPFPHLVWDEVPLLSWLFDLAIETDGGEFTVNIGGGTIADPQAPFAHLRGADYRAIYDLADLARSRFMIPVGPSGHPLSPWYGSLQERWRDGDYLSLGGSEAEVADRGVGVLRLTPAAGAGS